MISPASPVLTWAASELRDFATGLFVAAGLDTAKAEVVSQILVEGHLLGHDTHGLALAPRYLEEIESGAMTIKGEHTVLRDTGACVTWDGLRLPGVWLTASALELALQRVTQHGCVTVVIRNSHHIGCLAAYLSRATERGCMALISCSDPSQSSVAPFGGTQGVFTPNPVAAGFPTAGVPVLIDTSASITTNNMAARLQREGRRFDSPVLLDAHGEPSNDPAVLKEGGTLLPAGGLDHGQKGYGWALLAEALTQGLSGFGRADRPRGWGACVFVQVIDPEAFGGEADFLRQTEHLAQACRASPPRPGFSKVRLPGEAGLARKAGNLQRGVAMSAEVMKKLEAWAARLDVPVPAGNA